MLVKPLLFLLGSSSGCGSVMHSGNGYLKRYSHNYKGQ